MTETICIRCGKTHFFSKKWKEQSVRGQVIWFEESVCPDSDCQKIVEEKFAQMREKRLNFEKKN